MERLSGETLLTYVGGRASGAVPSVACVSTDSRKIGRECLFIPLKGERMDGHDFIRMAAENGAVCALSHRTDIGDVGIPVIYVEDTGKALCDLAGAYLRALAIPVIGVTGSVGKTTTREMIAAVMEQKYKTLQPEGNFNNEIGLPLTMLAGLYLHWSVPMTYLVMYLSEDIIKCSAYLLHFRSYKWIRPVI